MDNLSFAIYTSSIIFEEQYLWQAQLASVAIYFQTASSDVDGILRNDWTEWFGISGRNPSEWVDDLIRNQWTECVGIRIWRQINPINPVNPV